jgi:hypothetical protein
MENIQTRDTCIPNVWNTILCIPKWVSIYYNILTPVKTVSKFCIKWNEKIGSLLNWKMVKKKVRNIKEIKLGFRSELFIELLPQMLFLHKWKTFLDVVRTNCDRKM